MKWLLLTVAVAFLLVGVVIAFTTLCMKVSPEDHQTKPFYSGFSALFLIVGVGIFIAAIS